MEDAETDYTTLSIADKRNKAGRDAKFSFISNRKKKRALRGISKKGSVRRTPSSFQAILNKFYAQRAVPEQVDTELKKSGLILTENERQLLRSLIEAQTGIQRIGYPKLLIKPYMKIWKNMSKTLGGISNNLFYWQIEANANWPLNFSTIYYIKGVFLCSGSTPIVLQEDTELKESTYIDNTVDICVIYKKEVSEEVLANATMVGQNAVAFYGKQLYLYTLVHDRMGFFIIIATRVMTAEQVKQFYPGVTMIYEKKGIQRGLKKLLKAEGTYFFQKELELTNFANSYLQFNQALDFQVLMEAEVNLEELFATLVNNQNNQELLNGQLTALTREIYWENFLEYVDFYILYNSYINRPENAENLVKYRRQITVIRNHALKAKTLMMRYLDSFPSTINIDKLGDLVKKINEYLLEDEEVKADAVFYGEIMQFLANLGIRSIREYFNRGVGVTIRLMREACQALLNRDIAVADVVTKIRAVAVECLQFSLVGDYKVFPFVRSAYAFLGNTFGNKTIEELQRSLEAFRIRLENQEELHFARMDQIMDTTAHRLQQLLVQMNDAQERGGRIDVGEVQAVMEAIVNADDRTDLAIDQMDLREMPPVQVQEQEQAPNMQLQPINVEAQRGPRGQTIGARRIRRNIRPLVVQADRGTRTRNQYRRIAGMRGVQEAAEQVGNVIREVQEREGAQRYNLRPITRNQNQA